MSSLSDEIDRLLERYLVVLDQYTSVREELRRTHAATLQHIARANFSADRGLRYGKDFYDERMQASRRCRVDMSSEGVAVFEISKPSREGEIGEKQAGRDEAEKQDQKEPSKSQLDSGEEESPAKSENNEKPQPAPSSHPDPIRMFGILTPPSLRHAQQSAIHNVEDLIPRLMSVDAELKELEIRIRRARKYRKKEEENGGTAGADGGKEGIGR